MSTLLPNPSHSKTLLEFQRRETLANGPKEQVTLAWSILSPPQETVLRYFIKREDRLYGSYIESAQGLERIALRARAGLWNAYVQLNPTRQRNGHKALQANVSHFSFLFIDVDRIDSSGNDDWEKVVIQTGLALDAVLGEPYIVPAIVHSGRGVQLWVRTPPVALDPAGRRNIRHATGEVLKRLDELTKESFNGRYRIDTSCANLDRLARLPGSINQKSGLPAVLVDPGRDCVDLVGRLCRFAGDAPPAVEFDGSERIENWRKYIRHKLPPSVKDFISFGVESPGRRGRGFACAAAMRDNGATRAAALDAVWQGFAKSRGAEPLTIADASKVVDSAFRGIE